ncbi:MAG: hypothetical protein QJR14_03035 [Bacillota bacterium]|nr:hypothetical protein [Bacillota bacterium]
MAFAPLFTPPHGGRLERLRRLRWRWVDEDRPQEPAWNLALDEALAEAAGGGQAPPFIRLWTGRRSLVTSRYDPGLADLEAASAWCRRQGYQLLLRSSGGSAVVHSPWTLNLSVAVPVREGFPSIAEAYELLPAGLLRALAEMGLEVGFGSVPGSFCDGRWNLVADGRKLAGTAQRRRAGYVLWHAVLLVGGGRAEVEAMVADLRAFYEAAAAPSPPVLAAGAHTTVAEAWRERHPSPGRPAPSREEVAERIRDAYRRLYPFLSAEPPSREERERAARLAPSFLPESAGA